MEKAKDVADPLATDGSLKTNSFAPMKNIFWTGYSNNERTTAITDVQRVVSKLGDIIDVKLFSDISLSMVIEIPERYIDQLYHELQHIIRMSDYSRLHSTSEKERTIFLNITFSKGTGDLKVETPSVPG